MEKTQPCLKGVCSECQKSYRLEREPDLNRMGLYRWVLEDHNPFGVGPCTGSGSDPECVFGGRE